MLTKESISLNATGKVHWIDWCLFCDRLDEALKPLRDPKSQFRFWKLRRRPIKAQVLKNLQKVCEKEVQKQAILRDFILYCPSPSRKSRSVTNWHIQVLIHESSSSDQPESPPPVLDIPACISFPTSASAHFCTRSAPLQQQQQNCHVNHNSSPHLLWPDLDTVETVPSSAPFELHNSYHHQESFRSRSSSSLSSTSYTNIHNPFVDDPNDSPAMSRDGLLELDRLNNNMLWMSAPSLGGDYHSDRLPIPMPPPAPYFKSAA